MEVRTQEIIRYIDLRFKEDDLKELVSEINGLYGEIKKSHYHDTDENTKKIEKLLEFKEVISGAINQMRS